MKVVLLCSFLQASRTSSTHTLTAAVLGECIASSLQFGSDDITAHTASQAMLAAVQVFSTLETRFLRDHVTVTRISQNV